MALSKTMLGRYEEKNVRLPGEGDDANTTWRYEQFHRHLPPQFVHLLDVGCNSGQGGRRLSELNPAYVLTGFDCVPSWIEVIPACYAAAMCGVSTELPFADGSFDAVLAGEFLEHLYAADVDDTLCEFQRVLKIGGRLLLTTPNPGSLLLRLRNGSVYSRSHLSQHFSDVLSLRLRLHGFSSVRLYGSGRCARFVGEHVPLRMFYGSYMMTADKR